MILSNEKENIYVSPTPSVAFGSGDSINLPSINTMIVNDLVLDPEKGNSIQVFTSGWFGYIRALNKKGEDILNKLVSTKENFISKSYGDLINTEIVIN